MDDWKYIIFDRNTPVLFPASCTHSEIANALKHIAKPTSAGRVAFGLTKDGKLSFKCYGQSESLDLRALDTDARWINGVLGEFRFNR